MSPLRVATLCALLLTAVFPLRAEHVSLTVLATTDLHGNILPYDYFTAKPAERGLAKIATLIRREREKNPNTVLVDCGDTIQGAPLEAVYQYWVRTGKFPNGITGADLRADPMMSAMNRLGYDAMAVGNHEYNFGLRNFAKARGEAMFPWISANTVAAENAAIAPLAPYIVKTVAGVKVAIIGFTTPAVPSWEKPENYRGLRFTEGVESVRSAVAKLAGNEKPDIIIVAAHAGLDRSETSFENPIRQIATQVKGIDAIVFGHSHQQLEELRIGDVLLHQPKNWGISLGKMTFELEGTPGAWKVTSKSGRLIPVTKDVPEDREIAELAKPYHDMTEKWLNSRVAESNENLDGSLSRVMDTALLDAIQEVQLYYSKADVSMTAMFNPRVRFRKGPVTVREIAALYIYDNELYVIDGNGKMLREALENAARYFLTCPDAACSHGPLTNPNVIGFNFDVAQGVDYEIDLSQPEGRRIRNLRFRGKALEDAQPLRLAVNNYRAGGSAGYAMFKGQPVSWRSGEEIRDLIIDYYSQRKILPAKADGNWRIVPEAARKLLEAEALREAARDRAY